MKKKNIFIIIFSLITIFVIGEIITVELATTSKKNEEIEITDLGKLTDVKYIEISRHNDTYIISSMDIIEEMIGKINILEIEEQKVTSLDYLNGSSSMKDGYIIKGYNNLNKDKELFKFVFASDELMQVGIKEYKIISNGRIYDYLRKLCEYCIVPLPKLVEGSILKYEYSENLGELSKEEVFEIYCGIVDSKPIHKEEFTDSIEYESFVSIETVNDEFIDIYMVEDTIYTRYRIKNLNFSPLLKEELGNKEELEWKIECYYVLS